MKWIKQRSGVSSDGLVEFKVMAGPTDRNLIFLQCDLRMRSV